MQSQHRQHHPADFYQLENCIRFALFFIVGCSSLWIATVRADDYLKEAPSFLIPCDINDPKNGVCFGKAIENVFTNWKDGIPGLKTLGSIDPFKIKKLHLVQNNQNINIKLDLKDMQITGLSNTKVTKATVSDEYNFKVLVKIPSLRVTANYRTKGTILLLNLDSSGSLESELTGIEAFFSLNTKLKKVNNQRFFDVTSIQTSIKNIANFHIHFDNLFNNSPELTESANNVFNQNWRDIFEIMRPALEEALDAILIDRHKKIFNYVPVHYFLLNLP